jgi:hypothetical protein
VERNSHAVRGQTLRGVSDEAYESSETRGKGQHSQIRGALQRERGSHLQPPRGDEE